CRGRVAPRCRRRAAHRPCSRGCPARARHSVAASDPGQVGIRPWCAFLLLGLVGGGSSGTGRRAGSVGQVGVGPSRRVGGGPTVGPCRQGRSGQGRRGTVAGAVPARGAALPRSPGRTYTRHETQNTDFTIQNVWVCAQPAQPRRIPRMAIERIDIDVTSPGRNFVTAIVTTSDGLTGLGDATLNGRELAVA